jgi:hypothetical protein
MKERRYIKVIKNAWSYRRLQNAANDQINFLIDKGATILAVEFREGIWTDYVQIYYRLDDK